MSSPQLCLPKSRACRHDLHRRPFTLLPVRISAGDHLLPAIYTCGLICSTDKSFRRGIIITAVDRQCHLNNRLIDTVVYITTRRVLFSEVTWTTSNTLSLDRWTSTSFICQSREESYEHEKCSCSGKSTAYDKSVDSYEVRIGFLVQFASLCYMLLLQPFIGLHRVFAMRIIPHFDIGR